MTNKAKTFLMALLVSAGAYAQEFTVDNTTYTVNGDNTVEIKKGDTSATVLTVPSTVTNEGVTYTVTSIGEYGYSYSKAVSVEIPSSIKTIGYGAFMYADITSLTLHDGLEEIGEYAFSGAKCETLDIPGTVKTIGPSAFFGSSYGGGPFLKNLILHEGLEEIGKSAFYMNKIETLTIPSTVKKIGNTAFLYSTKLQTLNLNEGLEYIGDGAFNNAQMVVSLRNTTLTSVTIPSTVKYIGQEAFLKMPLTSLHLPAALEELGGSFAAGCNISTLTIDEANPNFHIVDGILYDTNNTILYATPQKGISNVTVAEGCQGINDGAFWGSEVTDITLPESVWAIGYGAFQESALTRINLPDGITYIDEYAFAGSNIENVVLPANMPYVYEATFAQCTNLKTVTMPSGLKAIDIRAFYQSPNITSVTCLGSTPPELPEIEYTSELPFSTSASTPLYVPKGRKRAYSNAGWGEYFTITETDKGTITVTATTPEDKGSFYKTQKAVFDVTFDQDVTIANAAAPVYVRESYLYMPDLLDAASWEVTATGSNSIRITGKDAAGEVYTFEPNPEGGFWVIIPAGIVTNEAGEVNDQYAFVVYGSDEEDESTGISQTISGTSEAEVARYSLDGRRLQGQQKGINIVKYADGSVRKVMVR